MFRAVATLTVVNVVMCLVGRGYQKVWVENIDIKLDNVFRRHRIHMVDDHSVRNVVSLNAEVETEISGDDVWSYKLPLTRTIEPLIQISLEAEGVSPNIAL